jgi:60 kDa SS-A/Ro ribonucleoprotein
VANKNVFANKVVPQQRETVNNAGGKAYMSTDKHALAQIAVTNTFNGTFYVNSDNLLATAKKLALDVGKSDPEFLAKVALYSRENGNMKDMPAFLMCVVAQFDTVLFRRLFCRIIDNGKMLRNFCQIARSGAAGRTFNLSAGTCRKAINEWFATHDSEFIFRAMIGNNPSLKDILKMAHPVPNSKEKAALFAYILDVPMEGRKFVVKGKDGEILYSHKYSDLPDIVKQYEAFKKDTTKPVPKVDFRLLDSLEIDDSVWKSIAKNASWTTTRMNLNTFARHNVFSNEQIAGEVARRLCDPDQIAAAKQFPYQLFTAWKATESNANIPFEVKDALHEAMEIAIENIPVISGDIHVFVDTSGSMGSPITGTREGSTTTTSCVDVAGLIASSILRKNKKAQIYTFDTSVKHVPLNHRDSVITNTKKLAAAGGGTDCSVGLRGLNQKGISGDVIVYVSDNESWVDGGYRGTGLQKEWNEFKKNNPGAKLICIDLTPNTTSQVQDKKDILQIGGFSDTVYNVMADFINGNVQKDRWVSEINRVEV